MIDIWPDRMAFNRQKWTVTKRLGFFWKIPRFIVYNCILRLHCWISIQSLNPQWIKRFESMINRSIFIYFPCFSSCVHIRSQPQSEKERFIQLKKIIFKTFKISRNLSAATKLLPVYVFLRYLDFSYRSFTAA